MLFSLSSYQLVNCSRKWERSFKKLLDKDHPETTRSSALIQCKIELSGHTSKNRTVNRYCFQVECTYRKRFKERLSFCDQSIKDWKTAELFWLNLRKYICVTASLSLYLCVYMKLVDIRLNSVERNMDFLQLFNKSMMEEAKQRQVNLVFLFLSCS